MMLISAWFVDFEVDLEEDGDDVKGLNGKFRCVLNIPDCEPGSKLELDANRMLLALFASLRKLLMKPYSSSLKPLVI